MLSAWQANHDIQFVLHAFSCIVYICDYMTKSHKGMSHLLAAACKEAREGNMTLKASVQHVGNKFLNSVEMLEQRCCWDLLEHPMTQSSVKAQFISTCPPDDRVFLAKDDKLLANMDPDSEDIRVARNIETYAKCPKQLEYWCLADFVSNLEISSTLTKESAHLEEVTEIDDINIDTSNFNNDLFPIHLKNTIIHK